MLIKTVNTGSKGNLYVFQNDNEILILECGVNTKEMLKNISFKTSLVSGCLLSHEHS